MRVIFMGTPAFAVPALAALMDSSHAVVAAYSQPPRPAGRGMKLTPSPVHQRAEAAGIPVFTPTSLKLPEVQAAFAAHQADIAVVAAYGLLLPQAILDAPRFGCINIHPSDLPRWRGAAPIQRTLMAGDRDTACCIIQLEAGLDTGPIHVREPFPIPPEMDAGALHDAMAEIGARQVLAVLDQLTREGVSRAVPQRAEGITYAEKIRKEDRPLDWNLPAEMLWHQVRGLAPAPCATAELGGETLKIYRAERVAGRAGAAPGTLLDGSVTIQCGDGGGLRLLEMQRPGKPRQSATQCAQGLQLSTGMRLSAGK